VFLIPLLELDSGFLPAGRIPYLGGNFVFGEIIVVAVCLGSSIGSIRIEVSDAEGEDCRKFYNTWMLSANASISFFSSYFLRLPNGKPFRIWTTLIRFLNYFSISFYGLIAGIFFFLESSSLLQLLLSVFPYILPLIS